MTEPRTRAELIAEFFARRPITAAAPPAPPGKLPDGADAPPAKPAPTDPDAKAAVSADADVTTALATVRTAVEAAIAAQAKDPEATTDPNDQKVNTDLQALLAALEAVETSQAADSDAGPQPKTPPAPAKPAPKAPFPPKAAPPVAAASNRFAGPVTPVGDTPPPVQQGGTNAGASGDVDPSALCKECGHLAASHADTAEGANTGACAMNGCACASTVVPDGENLDGPPDNPGQTPSGQLAISQAERDAAAKAGTAMPDGGYPIRNPGELDKAIHAVGRGGADHDKIRRHVIKRAKALGSPGKIPDNWNGDGSLKSAAQGRVTTTVIRPDGTIEHRSAFEDLAPLDPNLDLPKLLAPVAAVAPAPVAEGAAPSETSTTDQTAPMLPGGQAIGAAFTIPVGIIEGLQTSDGRMIQPNALTWREPPLPLMAMLTSSHGNDSMADAAVLVGRVESIARDGANITAAGHLLTNKDAIQFATDLEQMGQFGVSADVGDVTSIESMPEPVVSPQGVMTFDPAAMPIETLTSGVLMGFCYSDDTQILTEDGWKLFKDLRKGLDRVATRNPKTHVFEWADPTLYNDVEVESGMELIHFSARGVDLLVTPSHRMLVRSMRDGQESVMSAEDLERRGPQNLGIPMTSVWHDNDVQRFTIAGTMWGAPRDAVFDGDDFAAFLGAWLAEGSLAIRRGLVSIGQSPNGRGFEAYRSLLTRMLGREASHDGHAFYFKNARLARWLEPLGHAADKYVPLEVKDFSRRQLRLLWDYYMLGDGAADRPRAVTVSRRLADDLQEIAQKLGMFARIRTMQPKGSVLPDGRVIEAKNCRLQYIVQFRNVPGRRTAETSTGWMTERVPYEGHVYCVSVPNEFLYVRRNGVPAWCGNTACPFPAFPGCYIILGDGQDTEPIPMKAPTADQARIGLHILTTEECEPCAAGVESIAASASPLAPPLAWFETPEPDELTPLTVFEDGRVFGHLAGWSQCHVGRGGCLTPPADKAGYAYFLTGYVLCADGSEVPTGTITIDAMHAPGSFSLQAAMAHYDNTATGVAAVTIKNGKLGPWYCGAMFPGATAEQFHRLRANPPSGDWRPLGRGQHALCAMLAVNSQGFPIPRATVKNGKMLSLVAAGAPEMYALAHPAVPLTEEQRMERIESMMSHLAPMAVAGLRARFQRARGR
jgi:hypothetical protein